MKIRLLLALLGLAIGFALPTFAQQTNTPDPQLREQILAIGQQYDDALMNGDATALAALYTEDGVLVNDSGPIFGRDVIAKWYEIVFRNVQFIKHSGTLDEQSPSSINELWATGEWSQTVKGPNGPLDEKGYWTNIYTREGGVWKVRVNTWNRLKVY